LRRIVDLLLVLLKVYTNLVMGETNPSLNETYCRQIHFLTTACLQGEGLLASFTRFGLHYVKNSSRYATLYFFIICLDFVLISSISVHILSAFNFVLQSQALYYEREKVFELMNDVAHPLLVRWNAMGFTAKRDAAFVCVVFSALFSVLSYIDKHSHFLTC
jgi:hypothetical protein